jgi:serine/threonine protein phosphatase PrpC
MKTLRFRTAHESHPGMRRSENEDSYAIHDIAPLWAVADGMGGHSHGRFASNAVARNLQRAPMGGEFHDDTAAIQTAITAANSTVYARSHAENATIGTTVAALYINAGQAVCFWVGDSRIYRYREGQLQQLTRDHTQVRHLIDTRQITQDEARNHPMGHVLTRAVGVDALPRIEQKGFDAAPDDIFLLCSDGLTACASDAEIAEALRDLGGTRACGELLKLCLDRGAPDNVTIIAVVCDEVTAIEEVTIGA